MPLAACTTAPSKNCGVHFAYDTKTQSSAAGELDAMKAAGTFPITRMLLDDYKTTRDTIRACGTE